MRSDVVRAVEEVCGIGAADLVDDADLETRGIDSLDLIEIGMILEEQHGIALASEQFESVTTFGETVAVIERQKAAQDAAS